MQPGNAELSSFLSNVKPMLFKRITNVKSVRIVEKLVTKVKDDVSGKSRRIIKSKFLEQIEIADRSASLVYLQGLGFRTSEDDITIDEDNVKKLVTLFGQGVQKSDSPPATPKGVDNKSSAPVSSTVPSTNATVPTSNGIKPDTHPTKSPVTSSTSAQSAPQPASVPGSSVASLTGTASSAVQNDGLAAGIASSANRGSGTNLASLTRGLSADSEVPDSMRLAGTKPKPRDAFGSPASRSKDGSQQQQQAGDKQPTQQGAANKGQNPPASTSAGAPAAGDASKAASGTADLSSAKKASKPDGKEKEKNWRAKFSGDFEPGSSVYDDLKRTELVRTISASNPLAKMSITQTLIASVSRIPDIEKMIGRDVVPFFTTGSVFTLPSSLSRRPDTKTMEPAFRDFVFKLVLDEELQKRMEEAGVLNKLPMVSKLSVLRTEGDGNCLNHAAMLSQFGIHDRTATLRGCIHTMMTHAHSQNDILTRWKADQKRDLKLSQQTDDEFRRQYQLLAKEVEKPNAYLEGVHIMALAQVVRRPIIVYGSAFIGGPHGLGNEGSSKSGSSKADAKDSTAPSKKPAKTDEEIAREMSQTGGSYLLQDLAQQENTVRGIYLPILCTHHCGEKCGRNKFQTPILMCYHTGAVGNGHFSAVAVTDGDNPNPALIPLECVESNGERKRLPIRFLLEKEEVNQDQLLRDFFGEGLGTTADGTMHVRLSNNPASDHRDEMWNNYLREARNVFNKSSAALTGTSLPLKADDSVSHSSLGLDNSTKPSLSKPSGDDLASLTQYSKLPGSSQDSGLGLGSGLGSSSSNNLSGLLSEQLKNNKSPGKPGSGSGAPGTSGTVGSNSNSNSTSSSNTASTGAPLPLAGTSPATTGRSNPINIPAKKTDPAPSNSNTGNNNNTNNGGSNTAVGSPTMQALLDDPSLSQMERDQIRLAYKLSMGTTTDTEVTNTMQSMQAMNAMGGLASMLQRSSAEDSGMRVADVPGGVKMGNVQLALKEITLPPGKNVANLVLQLPPFTAVKIGEKMLINRGPMPYPVPLRDVLNEVPGNAIVFQEDPEDLYDDGMG